MSLSTRPINDLIRIAYSGGGFVLDATNIQTNDLIRIANAASNKSAKVVFTGITSRSTEDLIRIGSAGKGSVQFI